MSKAVKTIDQELQASNATIVAICACLAAVLPQGVVIPKEQDQLEAFFSGQLTALNDRATKAEADLTAANETAGKVPGLEQKVKDLEASNQTLTEANTKLTNDNKTLSEKEQDLDKRANAKFREFAAAQGLNPDAAPKAGKGGNGGPADPKAALEGLTGLDRAIAAHKLNTEKKA